MVRNDADSLVYRSEQLLKEHADKVSSEDKEKIEAALKRLRDALAGTDIDAVRSAHENLLSEFQQFSTRMYEHASAQQQSAAGGAPGAASDALEDDGSQKIVDDDQQMRMIEHEAVPEPATPAGPSPMTAPLSTQPAWSTKQRDRRGRRVAESPSSTDLATLQREATGGRPARRLQAD